MKEIPLRVITKNAKSKAYVVRGEGGIYQYTNSRIKCEVDVHEKKCTCPAFKYGKRPCKHLEDALIHYLEELSGIKLSTFWEV